MNKEEILSTHVPEKALAYCVELHNAFGFELLIKKHRKSKFGDYQFNPKTRAHRISVNENLNPRHFLLTYLHEVAHLKAHLEFGNRIRAHGDEWKQCFRDIAKPMLKETVFSDLLDPLLVYFKNPKATLVSSPSLYLKFRTNDLDKESVLLKDISLGEPFILNEKRYIKMEKKRTRSICYEPHTQKKYLISELAEVFSSQVTH